MPNGITWTVDTLSPRLAASAAKRRKTAGAALHNVAESWMTDIKMRTPVKFGNLRASEHVGEVDIDGRIISVDLNAGGTSASYAIIVHEDLDNVHPVGQAKYVESVIMERGPFMNQELGSFLSMTELI